MPPLREPGPELDRLASLVVAAASAVHAALGPGHLEAVYERALCLELARGNVAFAQQVPYDVHYLGQPVGRVELDLLIDGKLVVELKSVEGLTALHAAQVRAYLVASGCILGLLINFNVVRIPQGLRRIIETRAPTPSTPHNAEPTNDLPDGDP